MEKTINLRQMGILCFISILSLKTTLLPSLIHKDVGVNAFLVIAINCLIDLLTFFPIYYLLKKNQDITFYEFLQSLVGKVFAKIILFLMFLFFLFKAFLLIEGGYSYAREVIFQEASLLLFAYTLIICSISLYLFGSRSFARTIEFFYPIILVLLITFLVIPFMTTKMYDVRPLLDISRNKFWASVLENLMAGGDLIFLLLFMGKIKFDKNKTIWSTLIKLFYGFILITAFYFIFVSVFKHTGFLHPNAISELVQFIPTPSILGNFDWMTIVFVQLTFILNGALFTYGMCDSISNVLRCKRYNEDKAKVWIPIVLYAIIIITLLRFLDTFDDLAIFSKTYLSYLSLAVILIPFFILIVDFFTRKKRRVNEKSS